MTTGGDGLAPELEGGPAAGAPGLHVDDRGPGEGEGAEDPVPGGHAAVGRPAVGGLEPPGPDACLGHGLPHRRHAQVDQAGVVEPPERVHPHPADADLDAHSGTGAKAHVATPSPTSSVTRVMRWPSCRRVGSGSVKRVTTRRPTPSSSTTPKP